ncbi:MAG: carbohydrate-binding family 9-like protein [Flavobacteriales bacterium]|nr:carbohydrate-binding family 9-like protein [Flavobacteriales bacterium]
MQKIVGVLVGHLALCLSLYIHAQTPCNHASIPLDVVPATYVCMHAVDPIVVDGQDKERTWQLVPVCAEFQDIMGPTVEGPRFHTEVKMTWDEDHLYIYAFLEEPHVWGSLENRDDIIWRDNDIEFFFDPDGDGQHYMEFEYNALGTLLDLYLAKPYREGGPMLIEWDAKGVEAEVVVYGSVNNGSDEDIGWCIEMAIPFGLLKTHKSQPNPGDGTWWRMNMSRVQWDTQWTAGGYVKQTNAEGQPLPEHNWVWSPQGIVNMHYPEQWGYMLFSKWSESPDDQQCELPMGWHEAKYAYALYYIQKIYFAEHGVWCADVKELPQCGIPQSVLDGMRISVTASHFDAWVPIGEGGDGWLIDTQGRIIRKAAINE